MHSSALARVLALAADRDKLAKDAPAVDYRPSVDPNVRCGVCAMFKSGACDLVAGPIDPRDVCNHWIPRPTGTMVVDPGQVTQLSSGFVGDYERVEKGKLEKVSGYAKKVIGPASGGRPASEEYVTVKMPNGEFLEISRFKLWHKLVGGKPGPVKGMPEAGQVVTWRHQGKTTEGVVHGGLGVEIAPGAKLYPAQGNFYDAAGGKHWGWYGGAGLLLHHTDGKGTTRYLLQKRSFGVHAGGTYSTPGGAIDRPGGLVETPERAAFREAEEEGWGNLLPEATVTGVQQEHFGGSPGEPGTWTYHTVSAAVPEMKDPSGKGSHSSENAGSKWATPQEMEKLPLHPDFVATANKLGRNPDAPNPAPEKPSYSSNAPRHPLVRDDYKAGQQVTWRYHGEQTEGSVLGPTGGKPAKNKLPDAYDVQMPGGEIRSVKWGQLRLHPSEDPEGAKKAEEFEKGHTYISGGHGKSTQPTMGYGTTKAPLMAGELKAHSLSLPGLTHTVPSEVAGRAVSAVYEHPQHDTLILRDALGYGVGYKGGKIYAATGKVPLGKKGAAKLEEMGWKKLPVTPPPSQEQAQTGALGRVVSAAVKAKPSVPVFQKGDRVQTADGPGTVVGWVDDGQIGLLHQVRLDSKKDSVRLYKPAKLAPPGAPESWIS